MSIEIYRFIYNFILFFITLFLLLAIVFTKNTLITEYIHSYLESYEISYSKLEISLFDKLTVYDLHYSNSVSIKKLHIEYNFLDLLNQKSQLEKIEIENGFIDVDKILESSQKQSSKEGSADLIAFKIREIKLKDSTLLLSKESYDINASAAESLYDTKFYLRDLNLRLNSRFGSSSIEGDVKENNFIGDLNLFLNEDTKDEYFPFLKEVPQAVVFSLQANPNQASLQTSIKNLSFTKDENLSINNLDLKIQYQQALFHVEAAYGVKYLAHNFIVKQDGKFNTKFDYSSELNIIREGIPPDLGFKQADIQIDGDISKLNATIDMKELQGEISSSDYQKFNIFTKGKSLVFSDIEEKISFSSKAILDLDPLSVKGNLELFSGPFLANGDFFLDKQGKSLNMNIDLNDTNKLALTSSIETLFPINLKYTQKELEENLSLQASSATLKLKKKEDILDGVGSFYTTDFKIKGKVLEDNFDVDIDTKVNSLEELLNLFEVDSKNLKHYGKIEVKSSLVYDGNFSMKHHLRAPDYSVRVSEDEIHTLTDIDLLLSYENSILTVEEYSLAYHGDSFYSTKASKISFLEEKNIVLDEFWINDSLSVQGNISSDAKNIDLNLSSENFQYKGGEGKFTLAVDLHFVLKDLKEYINGDISILEGELNYIPPNDYSFDKDIIVLQDIKNYEETNRFVNVHIDSRETISYKLDNIDVVLKPDIYLIQEFSKDIELYGVVEVVKGEIFGGGKRFTFDKSDIYFSGGEFMNPQLNLNLHYYTLDYIDIEIYITNTLSSPVVLFSSNPAMSQDDIVSYILFGEKASTLFESSEESMKISIGSLVLGTGLKEIFNDASGVQVDTFSIMTNQEGTLGYEIGTRFNKNIRVLYRSDTISSVVLQYSLNSSVRVDVDIKDTGQGVSFIYVKDF